MRIVTPLSPSQARDALPVSWSRPEFHVADLRCVTARRAERSAPRLSHTKASDVKRISQPLVVGALLLFDVAIFAMTGLLSCRSAFGALALDGRLVLCSLLAVTGAGLFILRARWCYTVRALGDFPRQSFNLFLAIAAALALWDSFCLLAGAVEPGVLRQWTLGWFVLGWGYGALGRALFGFAAALWTREGRLARRAVIVGGGAHALETIRRLEKSGKGGLKILGLFDDRDFSRLPANPGGYRLLGAFDDLETFCRQGKVDLLIVAIPVRAEARILHILKKLWLLPVDVRILAEGGGIALRKRAYSYIGDTPFLPVFDKPLSDWDLMLKSAFDRCVAAILIVVLSPLLLALALGVKLSSPGPVFFVQARDGFNNRKFGVFKFRSMFVELCDASGEKLVTRDDPRLTKFGAFIRRFSLDELPQLFNILRGDLSLVGPRPHASRVKAAGHVYEEAVDGYFARHKVKPGITGWAQVNGWRGETDTLEKIEQRVAHDLYYIEHWSPWLDIKILAMTPFAVLFGKNAY